ncbi:unnamed protein product [Diabrotica balteata]|uniref:Uncharacterized protein n=1 Tax=Diabrotica balteata TaxID=107213 RepID=A0A9N9TEE0_DIABA|nr:unnamed protein product [Diabrotica balteata]
MLRAVGSPRGSRITPVVERITTLSPVALTNNLTEDDLQRYYLIPDTVSTTTAPGVPSGETTHARKEVTPATSPTSSTQAYIGLITGALAMVILLLACTVFLMIRRGRKKVALLHKHTALVSSSTKPTTINMKDLKNNMSTPIINNGLSRSRLSVKSKDNTIGSVASKKAKKCNLYGNVAGEESDSENSSVYHEPYKLLPNPKQEYDFTSVNSFPEEMKYSTQPPPAAAFYNMTPPPPPASRPPPTYDVQNGTLPQNGAIISENYYAATDIIKVGVNYFFQKMHIPCTYRFCCRWSNTTERCRGARKHCLKTSSSEKQHISYT